MVDIDPEDHTQQKITDNQKQKIRTTAIKRQGKNFKIIQAGPSQYQPDDKRRGKQYGQYKKSEMFPQKNIGFLLQGRLPVLLQNKTVMKPVQDKVVQQNVKTGPYQEITYWFLITFPFAMNIV